MNDEDVDVTYALGELEDQGSEITNLTTQVNDLTVRLYELEAGLAELARIVRDALCRAV